MQRITYSFRFTHHGGFSSYHRLLDYLPSNISRVTVSVGHPWLQESPRFLRLWLRANEYRLAPLMLTGRGKCVHYLYPENSLISGLRWRKNNKLVVTWHQPITYLQKLPEPFRSHAHSVLRQAAAVVFLSEESKCEHENALDLSNAVHIKHGVDTDFFTYSERKPANERIDIITVGNWLRDHRFWAETVRKLLGKHQFMHFTVLCNKLNTQLYQAKFPETEARVRFLSHVGDEALRDLYRQADIAFLPLIGATANNSLLECMASGIPCVVSDLPATREYAGSSAVFVSNLDSTSAANTILSLAASRNQMVDMARAARGLAERELSWPIVARRHCELYSLLERTAAVSD